MVRSFRWLFFVSCLLGTLLVAAWMLTSALLPCYTHRFVVANLSDGDVRLVLRFGDSEVLRSNVPRGTTTFVVDHPLPGRASEIEVLQVTITTSVGGVIEGDFWLLSPGSGTLPDDFVIVLSAGQVYALPLSLKAANEEPLETSMIEQYVSITLDVWQWTARCTVRRMLSGDPELRAE